jgi:hypothetical protein
VAFAIRPKNGKQRLARDGSPQAKIASLPARLQLGVWKNPQTERVFERLLDLAEGKSMRFGKTA